MASQELNFWAFFSIWKKKFFLVSMWYVIRQLFTSVWNWWIFTFPLRGLENIHLYWSPLQEVIINWWQCMDHLTDRIIHWDIPLFISTLPREGQVVTLDFIFSGQHLLTLHLDVQNCVCLITVGGFKIVLV